MNMQQRAAAAAMVFAGSLWAGGALADEVPTPVDTPPPGVPAAPAGVPPAPTEVDAAAPNAATYPPDLAAPSTRWGNRMLGGHTFLFPVTHPGPFVATYFGVGLGVYNESVPSVLIPGGGSSDLNLIGVTTTADLGIKITDWLGIEGQARALAIVGLDGQSLLYSGGQLNAGGFFAPIVRIARIESTGTQLSARAQMGWLRGSSLEIPRLLTLARSAIGSTSDDADPTAAAAGIGRALAQGGFPRVILAGADTFDLNGSIEAAQALGPMFGLQAATTLQRRVFGVTFNDPQAGDLRDSATRYDILLDASFEWDGMSKHIPVAAIVEYEAGIRLGGTGDEQVESEGTDTHTLGIGVYYSGRPNLQVGIFGASIWNLRRISGVAGAPGESGVPSARYGEMIIRYVW
jgi:hypothetical protein